MLIRGGALVVGVLSMTLHAEDRSAIIAEKSKTHWAFQQIKIPEIPKAKDNEWCVTPVDHFIQARLEEKDLEHSPEAEKATVLRRVTFDLTGLPPTLEELQAFLGDNSSGA